MKKVAIKPKRPVQRVEAIVINKDYDIQKDKTLSPKTPSTPIIVTPTGSVSKESIEVVVTDDIEKFKRNKTFRKSLRLSFKRPVSSAAQVLIIYFTKIIINIYIKVFFFLALQVLSLASEIFICTTSKLLAELM